MEKQDAGNEQKEQRKGSSDNSTPNRAQMHIVRVRRRQAVNREKQNLISANRSDKLPRQILVPQAIDQERRDDRRARMAQSPQRLEDVLAEKLRGAAIVSVT